MQQGNSTLQTDPLDITLHFDRWATMRIIDVLRRLDPEQLNQSFGIGIGSLRGNLIHVLLSMEVWFDRAADRETRKWEIDRTLTLDQIVTRMEVVWSEIERCLKVWRNTPGEMERIVSETFKAPEGGLETVRFARSAVLLHIFNHGTHHRVQCLNMLKQLGVNPLPDIDLIDSNQENIITPDASSLRSNSPEA